MKNLLLNIFLSGNYSYIDTPTLPYIQVVTDKNQINVSKKFFYSFLGELKNSTYYSSFI